MKKLVIFLVLFISISSVFAQKTAYIHRDSVYRSMPQMQTAQTELNDYLTQIQTEIETMQQDYQQKIQVFNENIETYSEVVKNNKVTEIQDLEKRIQDFQVEAQTEYLAKQQELLVPVQADFDKAVEYLRQKGLAAAAKRASRAANEGTIGSYVHAGSLLARGNASPRLGNA